MTTPVKVRADWTTPEKVAEVLPLSADEVRARCARWISSKGRDLTAIKAINTAPKGARKARWQIPVSELTDWPERQMRRVEAGGVL